MPAGAALLFLKERLYLIEPEQIFDDERVRGAGIYRLEAYARRGSGTESAEALLADIARAFPPNASVGDVPIIRTERAAAPRAEGDLWHVSALEIRWRVHRFLVGAGA